MTTGAHPWEGGNADAICKFLKFPWRVRANLANFWIMGKLRPRVQMWSCGTDELCLHWIMADFKALCVSCGSSVWSLLLERVIWSGWNSVVGGRVMESAINQWDIVYNMGLHGIMLVLNGCGARRSCCTMTAQGIVVAGKFFSFLSCRVFEHSFPKWSVRVVRNMWGEGGTFCAFYD